MPFLALRLYRNRQYRVCPTSRTSCSLHPTLSLACTLPVPLPVPNPLRVRFKLLTVSLVIMGSFRFSVLKSVMFLE